jgi:hypothetical protein
MTAAASERFVTDEAASTRGFRIASNGETLFAAARDAQTAGAPPQIHDANVQRAAAGGATAAGSSGTDGRIGPPISTCVDRNVSSPNAA